MIQNRWRNTKKWFDFMLWPDSDSNFANKHLLCRVVVVHTTYIIELCLGEFICASWGRQYHPYLRELNCGQYSERAN